MANLNQDRLKALLSAMAQAIKELQENGPAGGGNGQPGQDGREVEFQVADGYIQWHYVGDVSWTNLISLENLKGPQGEQGPSGITTEDSENAIEIADELGNIVFAINEEGDIITKNFNSNEILKQEDIPTIPDITVLGSTGASTKYIKKIESAGHTITVIEEDLPSTTVPIEKIKYGDTELPIENGTVTVPEAQIYTHPTTPGNKHIPAGGTPGQFLKNVDDGTSEWSDIPVNIEDPVAGYALEISDGDGNIILAVTSDGELVTKNFNSEDILQESGQPGQDGQDGREIELQKSSTHIQWRYVGDSTWINLVALSDLKGANGVDGSPGADGVDGKSIELQKTSTHIQWRQTGGSWTNLIALSELKGADGTNGVDGKSVELRVNAGNIEWRQEGGSWINLMSLEDLSIEASKNHITLYINDLSNVTPQEKTDIINTLTPLMNAGSFEEIINPELFSNIMLVVGDDPREVYMLKRIDSPGQLNCYLYFETMISGIKKSIELYVKPFEGSQDFTLTILDDEPVSKMITVTNTTFTINSSNVYNNTTIIANSSSNMTITIPQEYSLQIGTMVNVIKANLTSVDVNITGGSGVTLYHNGATGTYKIPKQYQGCTLVKQSNSAWYIIGPEA